MSEKKKILMTLPHMVGGGAERVAAMLLNEFYNNGYDAEFLLTQSKKDQVINRDLKAEIPLTLIQESIVGKPIPFIVRVKGIITSLISKCFKLIKKPVPALIAKASFCANYYNEIVIVREKLVAEPNTTVVVFSQPSIPIVLMAAKNLPNRVVISERADPNRLMRHRYGRKFIEKYYTRADAAVFQTYNAKNTYPKTIGDKGTVISNPIKSDLPEAYHGNRNKNITTFCRISAQKNLPLLLEAFNKLHKDHPDYVLRIIGDSVNEEGREIEKQLHSYIKENELEDSVVFEPFNPNVHETIIKDAMYVNSSDYEGISNAMLEAMAIGLPSVCTDCPIGGACATITDGVNGLLVPVKNPEALYKAMKRVVEEDDLAKNLSAEGEKLREKLSLSQTAKRWMELF